MKGAWVVAFAFLMTLGLADSLPERYQKVDTSLGRHGDYSDGVYRIGLPRNDLSVAVQGRALPTAFGFGGWVAMTKATGANDVLMGDLVLQQDEVNPVMSALLDHGLDVTALHNHFFFDEPRILYMHVHGYGAPADLARRLAPALALIPTTPAPQAAPIAPGLDTAALDRIVGARGATMGAVHKYTIGRSDLKVNEMGARINSRMGLNTWASFFGNDADAVVAGDVAMLEGEVRPVLRALRGHGLSVVAIHHHMTGARPMIFFLHYWGQGPAADLAEGFRAALNELGKPHGRGSGMGM